jgi:hypothetical protein
VVEVDPVVSPVLETGRLRLDPALALPDVVVRALGMALSISGVGMPGYRSGTLLESGCPDIDLVLCWSRDARI